MVFSEKPIKTIIYTQANSDLLLGSEAFVEECDGSVEIIAPEDILDHFSESDNPDVIPTHTFKSEFSLNVSDVKMNLVFGFGEFSDQMYISLPDDNALIIGDTIYGVAPYILDIKYFQFLTESS